jgi:hypothetical protein
MNPMAVDRSGGLTSIYVMLLLGFGLCVGAVAGIVLGNFFSSGLLIGVVAALVSVVTVGQARALVLKFFPSGTVPDELSDKFPRIVHMNALVVSLLGGMAGHDVSREIGESSGLWIGGFSGLFASVAMLGLMFTYFYRNPEFGPAATTTSEEE